MGSTGLYPLYVDDDDEEEILLTLCPVSLVIPSIFPNSYIQNCM